MHYYYTILLLCLFHQSISWANTQDSSNGKPLSLVSTKKQVEHYNQLSKTALIKDDIDAAIHFATRAWQLANQYDYQVGLIESNLQLNEVYLHINTINQQQQRIIETKTSDLLHAQREVQNIKSTLKNHQNLILVGIITLGIIILLLFYYFYRQKKHFQIVLNQQLTAYQLELKHTKELLKEARMESQRFAYIASHDLKEPLRNIASFTTLLKRRLFHQLDKDCEDYFQFVMTSTKQITDLVSGIFEYAQLDKNALTLNYVDSNQIIPKVIQALQPLIKEKNAKIVSHNLPTLYSNASYLQLIFKNIIENGIRYNHSEQPTITITAIETSNAIEFSIKDNGIGISSEYHQYIFEMFRRLQDRQQSQSSGLGLAICKKIVTRLHGELSLQSKQGHGSTFFIRFPKSVFKLPDSEKLSHLENSTEKLNFSRFILAISKS